MSHQRYTPEFKDEAEPDPCHRHAWVEVDGSPNRFESVLRVAQGEVCPGETEVRHGVTYVEFDCAARARHHGRHEFVARATTAEHQLYPLMVLRMARYRVTCGESLKAGLLYGAFLSVGRWAQLLGQVGYLADRLMGRKRPLDESKRPTD